MQRPLKKDMESDLYRQSWRLLKGKKDVPKTGLNYPFFFLWMICSSEYHTAWRRGETLANAQNFARTLMEMPANKLTPTSFSEIAHNKRQRTDLPITIQAQ